MAEPAAPGIAIAAGAITITGSIFGVHYDALLAGFAGGLVSLSYLPHMPPMRIAGSVATSALLAGFFAPIVGAAAVNYLPWIATVGADVVRISSAAALGLCWQVVLPAGLDRLRGLISPKKEEDK